MEVIVFEFCTCSFLYKDYVLKTHRESPDVYQGGYPSLLFDILQRKLAQVWRPTLWFHFSKWSSTMFR